MILRLILYFTIVGIPLLFILYMAYKPKITSTKITSTKIKDKIYSNINERRLRLFLSHIKNIEILDLRHRIEIIGKYNLIDDYIFYYKSNHLTNFGLFYILYENKSGKTVALLPDMSSKEYRPIVCTLSVVNEESSITEAIENTTRSLHNFHYAKENMNFRYTPRGGIWDYKGYKDGSRYITLDFNITPNIKKMAIKNNLYGTFILYLPSFNFDDGGQFPAQRMLNHCINNTFCGICFKL